jgi:6-phosphogluconolactonase
MIFEPAGTLPGTLSMRIFDAHAKLAQAVVAAVHEAVLTAVRERGRASLVIAGGSLPPACGPLLAALDLPWQRVEFAPADEQRLPPDDPRSPARCLRETLLHGTAAEATFVPLFDPADIDPLAGAAERLEAMARPFDLVLLGMGPDGEIAALRRDAPGIEAALDPDSRAPICLLERPPGIDAVAPRLSLTLRALLDSRRILITARGLESRESFERSLLGHGPADSALQALAQHAHQPIDFCWCR